MSIHPATVHLHPGAIAMAFLSSVFLQSKRTLVPQTVHGDLWFQTSELPLGPYHDINKVPHIGQRLRSLLPLRVLIFDSDSPKDQWMRRAEAILELVSAALSFLSASGPLTVTLDSKHSWFLLTHVIVETTFRIFRRAPVDPDPSFVRLDSVDGSPNFTGGPAPRPSSNGRYDAEA
ncbi:hypothetical protein C8J56DRAFT_1087032 [Mycena floridula]|nr:hypothetical protein C8J56DRAFT_1087032 [Mycena floridula]